MMAWRLCRERYAKLDGIGAARVGGRWNPAGLPMVYLSTSDALAVLEVRVHLRRYIPDTFVFVTVDIPAELILPVEGFASLAEDWRDNLAFTQAVGRRFIREGEAAGLSVPSRLVPVGRNLLINPDHPDFSQIVIHPAKRFEWDERLWEGLRVALSDGS